MDTAATIKTIIVDALIGLPTLSSQRIGGAIVRFVWKGFGRA
jgi:hypothetical protein